VATKDYQQSAREFASQKIGCNMVGVGMSNSFNLLYCIRRFGWTHSGDPNKMLVRWAIGNVWIEFYATHYRITPADYITTAEGLAEFEDVVMGMLHPVAIDGVEFNFLGELDTDPDSSNELVE